MALVGGRLGGLADKTYLRLVLRPADPAKDRIVVDFSHLVSDFEDGAVSHGATRGPNLDVHVFLILLSFAEPDAQVAAFGVGLGQEAARARILCHLVDLVDNILVFEVQVGG